MTAAAFLIAGAVVASAATVMPEGVLEPGGRVEGRLAPGESRAYGIACAAGTYVYVVVEQKGVDLTVTVTGPDGAEVLEVDTPTEPSGSEGEETVPFVAERRGVYRIRVHAPGAKVEGGYVVRLQEQRRAEAADRQRFEARRLWAEGRRSRGRGNAEGLQKAAEAFARSGRLLEQVGDDYDAARVLKMAGDMAARLGQAQVSVDHYEHALSLAAAAGAPRIAGLAHLGIGVGSRILGAPERARDHHQQALEIFQSLHDGRGMGAALTGLAATQWEDLANASEALRLLDQALDLGRSLHDGVLERAALHDIASIHDWSGEKQRALGFYQQALTQERAAGDRLATAMTLDEVGHLYAQWGDLAQARDAHAEALELARQVGNRPHEVWALLHVGRMDALLGRREDALRSLDAALRLSREIKDRAMEAHALSRLGEMYALQGDSARAREHLRAGIEIYRGLDVKYWPALARLQLGRVCLAEGDAAAARGALVEALEGARVAGASGLQAAAHRELARAALQQGDAEAALRESEEAVALVEAERVKIDRQDFRTTYFASVHPYYQTQIEALVSLGRRDPQGGYAARALQVSERARARIGLEAVAEAALDARPLADPALTEREGALRRELSALAAQQSRLAESGGAPARQARLEAKLRALSSERQDVLARLRQSNPRYAALVQPPILEAEQIQAALDGDTALLEYALGEERSHLFVVTRSSLSAYELPGGEALGEQARRVHQGLSARAQESAGQAEGRRRLAAADRSAAVAAAELSRLILPPGLEALGVKRLVIVADGELQLVPFAALPASAAKGARPLLSRFEIVYAPSASWAAALRSLRERVPAPPKALAVLADPVFDRTDSRVGGGPATPSRLGAVGREAERAPPRLPLSRREALRAASLLPRREVLLALDFEASRERALSPELAEYRVVHFATHSVLNAEQPDLSGVVLSLVDRSGNAQDGFLRLSDIYGLRLPAELVVLSACQTAAGKSIPGEGVMGLARGFMHGGVRQVAASLWPVDETATAELMTAFYRELLRNTRRPAEALRRAQLRLASNPRWRPAYYWAGFVIQGDWP